MAISMFKASADKSYSTKISVAFAPNTQVTFKALVEAASTATLTSSAYLGFNSAMKISYSCGKQYNLFNLGYTDNIGWKTVDNKQFIKVASLAGDLKYTNILQNVTYAKAIAFISGGWGINEESEGSININLSKKIIYQADKTLTFAGSSVNVVYIKLSSEATELNVKKTNGEIDFQVKDNENIKLCSKNNSIIIAASDASQIELSEDQSKLNTLEITSSTIKFNDNCTMGTANLVLNDNTFTEASAEGKNFVLS